MGGVLTQGESVEWPRCQKKQRCEFFLWTFSLGGDFSIFRKKFFTPKHLRALDCAKPIISIGWREKETATSTGWRFLDHFWGWFFWRLVTLTALAYIGIVIGYHLWDSLYSWTNQYSIEWFFSFFLTFFWSTRFPCRVDTQISSFVRIF